MMLGAYFCFTVIVYLKLSFFPAFIVSLIISAFLGFIINIIVIPVFGFSGINVYDLNCCIPEFSIRNI